MPERASRSGSPKLLAGGNPQIPKGEGDGPVQDYIAAMPEWKSDIGRRVDALVTATLPDVRKAVKWNSVEAVRSIDIREDDEIDDDRLSDWVRQAAELPGVKM